MIRTDVFTATTREGAARSPVPLPRYLPLALVVGLARSVGVRPLHQLVYYLLPRTTVRWLQPLRLQLRVAT